MDAFDAAHAGTDSGLSFEQIFERLVGSIASHAPDEPAVAKLAASALAVMIKPLSIPTSAVPFEKVPYERSRGSSSRTPDHR